MIHTVYHKESRTEKDEFDISYYIETKRNSVDLIYEYTGLYRYDFRRYSISFNYPLRNEYYIIDNLTGKFEKVYSSFNETRKLAIIVKFVAYIISKDLDIPLYKLVKSVTYEANGDVQQLSTNAFVKGTYKICQEFQKLGL